MCRVTGAYFHSRIFIYNDYIYTNVSFIVYIRTTNIRKSRLSYSPYNYRFGCCCLLAQPGGSTVSRRRSRAYFSEWTKVVLAYRHVSCLMWLCQMVLLFSLKFADYLPSLVDIMLVHQYSNPGNGKVNI